MGKRLLTLVLDVQKLRNFQSQSKGKATVDALWVCIHLPCRVHCCYAMHTLGI